VILIRRPWTRQPELPDWTALSKRAARLIHTGRGYVANGKGQPLVSAVVSATLPLEDGAFLVGRNEAGQIRCGRWTLVDNQPSSLTAFCLVFSARRTTGSANDGFVASWGDTSTGTRCHVKFGATSLSISLRQGLFDTPRVQSYSLTAGIRYTWAVRAVAGVGIEVWRGGALLTPTSSSGTMPASSFYTLSSQHIWFGGEGDFSAFGGHYGQAIWLEDVGDSVMQQLSADMYNGLFEPRRIWVPSTAAGGGLPTLTWAAPTVTATTFTPRVTYTY